jgi:hypothetical protein
MLASARRCGGFSISETFALCAGLLIAVSLLVASAAKTRSASGLNRDLGNLRLMGEWTASYTADFEDRVWGYTSRQSQWPALKPTGNPITDAARQAIDIIRRRTGREDFPLLGTWAPHISYSHLVLADYADVSLPDRRFVATGDVHRMNWTDDPVNKHDQGFWQPFQNPSSGPVGLLYYRWPYSSSYTIPPAWFDKGQSSLGSVQRMGQVAHNSYYIPAGVQFGAPRITDVAFPSQKVLMQDYGDWYTAQTARYYGVPDATISVLMSDGAAGARRTRDANEGWRPNFISGPDPVRFPYSPREWEPPTSTGEPEEMIEAGYYRWTRGGILGRDFGGEEIDTGQR